MMRRLAFGGMLILVLLGASGGVASASAPQGATAEQPEGGTSEKKADAASAGEGLNPIKIDFGLSFWTAVVFLLVLAVLSKYAWKPISEGLLKRENQIAGEIADAHRQNEEARKLLAEYEKKHVAAHEEIRGLIEQGRRDAEKVGQQVMEKAREEAAIERQRALQQIESATSAALKELADRSATLAVELAGKIVGAQLKAADHSRLIEQSLSEFARSKKINVN
jgi:F-type H+-transporting ATPase subunit b